MQNDLLDLNSSSSVEIEAVRLNITFIQRVACCQRRRAKSVDKECGVIGQSERFKITATLIASIASKWFVTH